MKILIVAEHDNTVLQPVNAHTITAALQLGQDIDVIVIGHECNSVVTQLTTLQGVKRILVADAKEYAHQLAENTAALIANLAPQYQVILAAATTDGKNSLPRVAALLNVDMVGDVIKIIAPDTFVRPIYAGNALATVRCDEVIKILTVRSTNFSATPQLAEQTLPIEKVTQLVPNTISEFVSQHRSVTTRPELTNARIVVAGGRGLKSAENFKLLSALADSLGAALGASRAAVDAGFVSNDYQVGQTGKVVAPELYFAIGISGAIQHLAGMKDSKVIVAINSDPDAPIFTVADYGLVADLFTVLPELQAELTKCN